MRRRWRLLIAGIAALAVLLAVNTVVTDSETKPAGVNVAGGQILDLSSVDLQFVDQPATNPGPAGEGAPIVLLHCYGCSLRWWDALVPLINAGHRVVRVDLVGFGGSAKPKSGYSIAEQARAVAEGLSRLGVTGAVVIGHSMGGKVATATAEAASELVDRVAVIGTPSTSEQAELPFVARLSYAPVLGQALWRLRPSALIRREYESAFAPGFDYESAFENPDQVVDDNRAMTFTSYERAQAESEDYTDQGTIATRIGATGVPFLAILGAEDQIVDTAAAASSFEAVPGATIRILDGVGHSANLEVPERTAEILLRFAAAAPSPSEIAAGERAAQREARLARERAARARRAERRRAARAESRAAAKKKQGGSKPRSGQQNGGQPAQTNGDGAR